jgi:hypothetical protein
MKTFFCKVVCRVLILVLVVAGTRSDDVNGIAIRGKHQLAHNNSNGLRVRPDQSRTICTDGMPPQLARFGISDLCMDIDVYGCGETVGVGVRFKESATYIAQQDIDTTFPQICVPTQNMTNSPLQVICKSSVLLCITFMRLGQNTLVIGPDYAAGCPTFTIGNCQLPIIGPIPTIDLPLDCFDVGQGNCTHAYLSLICAHAALNEAPRLRTSSPTHFLLCLQTARISPTAKPASRTAGSILSHLLPLFMRGWMSLTHALPAILCQSFVLTSIVFSGRSVSRLRPLHARAAWSMECSTHSKATNSQRLVDAPGNRSE